MLKGIKLRLYPNKKQQNYLLQMFGNDRFVWNKMLTMATARYQNNPKSKFITKYGMDALLKPLKTEYPFLKQSDSTSLQVVNCNLDQAFKQLFKHCSGYPRFKSRKACKQSYTGKSRIYVVSKRYIRLPKVGCIKTSKTNCLHDCKIKRYTVSLEPTGKYYLSLQVETVIKQLPRTDKQVGIDMGVADLAITSDQKKYTKFSATWYEKQVIIWQSKFFKRKHNAFVKACQYNHTHKNIRQTINNYVNWQKARKQKAVYQAKIANKRKDYLYKITTELVKQYDVIIIEDLKTKNLMKNHHLAKAIANNAWYMFRTMLEYKCKWYGKTLIAVDPKYTSQNCSNCGFCSGPKPLNIREWTCPKCHTHHDRDVNAAVNILHKVVI